MMNLYQFEKGGVTFSAALGRITSTPHINHPKRLREHKYPVTYHPRSNQVPNALLHSILVSVGIAVSGPAIATKLRTVDPALPLVTPNAAGSNQYFVLLRADYVAALGSDGVPPAINPRELRPGDDSRAWHRPEARKMVYLLENEFGFSATAMTSWIAPSMTVYLSSEQLAALEADPRVDRIEFVTQSSAGATDFSSSPPWSNDTSGSDYISYGKYAMDVNDNVTPSNKVYMVDAGISSDGLSHQDLDAGHVSQPWHGIGDCGSSPQHATAVASVLAAEHNNVGVKGINNASPVVSIRKGCTHADLPNALDYVVADLESNGEFAVISLSANSTSYADGTTAAQYIRKASARALFVQSAGNQGSDACSYAYSPAIDGDGILVIGAVDEGGDVVSAFDQTGVGGGTDPGSNSGSCVEAFAPGQRIWIDWPDYSHTARYRWSGTSFAAPHIAALASRYGNSSTNPVIREAYVRAQLFSTGDADPITSAAVKIPSYTQSPLFALPAKLSVSGVSVSSTYGGYVGSNAVDSDYLTTAWNSGVTPSYPSIQPYIELDLGSSRTLYSMRFMPAQSPSGASIHDVYVGNSSPASTLAGTVSRDIMNGEMMAVNLSGYSGRFVRIVTRYSPSWASYYEVEVFGN